MSMTLSLLGEYASWHLSHAGNLCVHRIEAAGTVICVEDIHLQDSVIATSPRERRAGRRTTVIIIVT